MTRWSEEDRRWMARALALARRGEGLTRPNPPVGAVLVRVQTGNLMYINSSKG